MANNIDFRVKNGLIVATSATIQSTSTTFSSTSGALVVSGGVGIGGGLFVAGVITATGMFVNGSAVVTQATAGGVSSLNAQTGTVNILAGTDTAVYSTSSNITIWNTSTLQSITSRGSTTTNAVSITNTNSSISTTTGALTITGGVGIGGNLNVGGSTSTFGGSIGINVPFNSLGNWGSTATSGVIMMPYGSIYNQPLPWGPGIGMALNGLYGVNGWVYQNAGPASAYSQFLGNHTWWTASSGTAALSTLTYVQVMTLNTSGQLSIFSTASSTSTTTGAVVIIGGVGIGGALYVANTSYIAGAQIITTATIGNYAAASSGASTGTTSTFFINNTTTSTGTTTGALVVAGGVGIGGNLYVASTSYVAGAQVITTATIGNFAVSFNGGTVTNTTTFLGTVLINNATSATTTSSGALQVVGGVGIGGSVYIGNTATITSTVNATSTATGAFQVRGGVGIGGSVYIGNTATITSAVNATSTATGAFQVVGGVGIGGALYVNTTSYVAGAQIVTTATIGNFAASFSGGTVTNATTFLGTVLVNNATSATSTSSGALQVVGGVGIGGALYVQNAGYIGSSAILTAANIGQYTPLRGQYVPRTGYITTSSLAAIDSSIFDNVVINVNGGTQASPLVISMLPVAGWTPFDGQKLIIRIYHSGPSSTGYWLSWTTSGNGSNNFRVVGITPPQITSSGLTMYIGVMYNTSALSWDILSAVVQ